MEAATRGRKGRMMNPEQAVLESIQDTRSYDRTEYLDWSARWVAGDDRTWKSALAVVATEDGRERSSRMAWRALQAARAALAYATWRERVDSGRRDDMWTSALAEEVLEYAQKAVYGEPS